VRGGGTPILEVTDPVCDSKHLRTMAEAFLRGHPMAIFVQARGGLGRGRGRGQGLRKGGGERGGTPNS
jgi:hypothetical protein